MAAIEWNAVPAKMTDHPSVEAIRTMQCHLLFSFLFFSFCFCCFFSF